MMIEVGKQYRTRDGFEVRVYATDGGGSSQIHGAVKDGNGWIMAKWDQYGVYPYGLNRQYDLIEVKPLIKRDVWINVYRDVGGMFGGLIGSAYVSRAFADAGPSHRIACIKITIDCEEGEGL